MNDSSLISVVVVVAAIDMDNSIPKSCASDAAGESVRQAIFAEREVNLILFWQVV